MKQFWRNNSLSLVLFSLFLLFLFGQAVTGYQVNNQDLSDHGQSTLSASQYLASGHFGEAVFENWESEFLQMAAYIFLTVFLFQKGSAESKDPDKREAVDIIPSGKAKSKDAPWPMRRGKFVRGLYKNSLGLVFLLLFLGSFTMHAVEGSRENCSEGVAHNQGCETFKEYVTGSQFWFESFQNWQSEFLAVGSIVVLSIFLRQAGSPESKPVTASNKTTS